MEVKFDWSEYLRKDGQINPTKLMWYPITSSQFDSIRHKYDWCKSTAELYYCDTNNITEQPKCYCGESIKYKKGGYTRNCSITCLNRSDSHKIKIKTTNLERYGVENANQSDIVKLKTIQTNLERYGVENANQSDIVKIKIKTTNLERYGVENVSQVEAHKEKRKQTNLERHGVEYPTQNTTVKLKQQEANLRKYGVEYLFQHEEFKEHHKQTNLERYGVEYYIQKHLTEETLNNIKDIDWLTYQHHILMKPLRTISKELGMGQNSLSRIFARLNIDVIHFTKSRGEVELGCFIRSIYVNRILYNDRTILHPLELDIYIPELNLAFEYDGEYWHKNSKEKDKKKTKDCYRLGITLYHIHERLWLNSNEHMKLIIKNIIDKRYGERS